MERGILLSLMALEKEFLTRHQFLAAFDAWTANRSIKLDESLVQRAYLTSNQLERLASKLLDLEKRNDGDWKTAILTNTGFQSVYDAMLVLAKKEPAILEMVTKLGDAMKSDPLKKDSSGTVTSRIDQESASDPHATIDSDFDPYATVAAFKVEQAE